MIFLPEAASAYHRNHSNFKPFKFRQLPSGKLTCRRRRPADIGYSDSESATSGARAPLGRAPTRRRRVRRRIMILGCQRTRCRGRGPPLEGSLLNLAVPAMAADIGMHGAAESSFIRQGPNFLRSVTRTPVEAPSLSPTVPSSRSHVRPGVGHGYQHRQ